MSTFEGKIIAENIRIGIVVARFNAFITSRLLGGAMDGLLRHDVKEEQIDVAWVPGAFEIPLMAKKLAESGQFDAIIACALIVNGGIYRHEFVTTAVIDGLMRVQLDSGVPVLSAVLTPHQFHEHATHREWFTAHFVIKGQEAARATLQTVALHQRVSTLTAR